MCSLLSVSGTSSKEYRGEWLVYAAIKGIIELPGGVMPKSIFLLADGTGNAAANPFKTNVWRLYAAGQQPCLIAEVATVGSVRRGNEGSKSLRR
jgi:hypothetical protein